MDSKRRKSQSRFHCSSSVPIARSYEKRCGEAMKRPVLGIDDEETVIPRKVKQSVKSLETSCKPLNRSSTDDVINSNTIRIPKKVDRKSYRIPNSQSIEEQRNSVMPQSTGRLKRTALLESSEDEKSGDSESSQTAMARRKAHGRRRVVWDDDDGPIAEVQAFTTGENEKRKERITNSKVVEIKEFNSMEVESPLQTKETIPTKVESTETSKKTLKSSISDTKKQSATNLKKARSNREKAMGMASDPPYSLDNKQDVSQHEPRCYICDDDQMNEINVSNLNEENKCCSSLVHCYSCTRSFHRDCLSPSVEEVPNEYWICPVCDKQNVVRTRSFFRYGKRFSALSTTTYDEYLSDVIGLTGYVDGGCGKCGKPSSQRRLAVICDNCDREWHLECMAIDTDEIPWGNWLCPDCREMHICTFCILSKGNDCYKCVDTATSESESIQVESLKKRDVNTVKFYHDGKLLKCNSCQLKYHYHCVRFGAPYHLKYFWADLKLKYETEFEEASKEAHFCSSDNEDESNLQSSANNKQKKKAHSIKSNVDALGLSRIENEPWCCPQCQEHYGIQKIVTQRRWKNPFTTTLTTRNEPTEETQLLVKLRNLSHRALFWLPADRVKVLYPTGFRKWQASDINDISQDVSETESGDVEDVDSAEDEEQTEVKESRLASQLNSSSAQKVIVEPQHQYSFFIHRPSGVKPEWFRPNRVLASRRCSRGSYQIEYLVKWCDLSYQEVSWESLAVVRGTRALRFFEACHCLERLLVHRPKTIVRGLHNPTVIDRISETHSHLAHGASLVPGREYLIKTVGCKHSKDTPDISSLAQSIASEEEGSPSSAFSSATAPIESLPSLAKRQDDFRRGLFVSYIDRPKFLHGHFLFDYQLEGLNWIRFAWCRGRSVILADEMGLGKTVQVISFLGSLWNDFGTQGPFLVIAPLATIEDVWIREFSYWAPFINVVPYFGNPEAREICRDTELFYSASPGENAESWIRSCFSEDLTREYDRQSIRPRLPKLANAKNYAKFDALVTSYEIFRKDHWLFQQIDWKVIIVDEGHRLKSFSSEVKRSLEGCKSDMRLLLTGTPLQNSIDELFSLLNVLHPEKFPEGCKENFQDVTQEATIEKLKTELQPHILRRIKKDVMGGRMPTKKERVIRIENSPSQKEIYKNIILRNHVVLGSPNGSTPLKKNTRVASLRNIVMQMRKCCDHPYLFEEILPVIKTEEDFKNLVESSGKLHLLDRMLALLFEGGHRVLVFSQFMRMLDVLEEYLVYRKYGYERLDGSTASSDRQKAIDRFNTQPQKKFVFLLSTRAGGLGINLTSADTVVIFDSDWNPHNDLQAQARAHRLGQTKKVAIFRFMTRASVEERIIEIARNKLVLDQVVAGRLDPRDAEAVVRCGAKELFDDASSAREVSYDDVQLKEILNRDIDPENETDDKPAGVSGDTGVLDAFKIAHFEERSDDAIVEMGGEGNDDKFWSGLLKSKINEEFIATDDHEGEELGRGMRARREVQYFGQKISNSENQSQLEKLLTIDKKEPNGDISENAYDNQTDPKEKLLKKRKTATTFEKPTALLLYRCDNRTKIDLQGIISETNHANLDRFQTAFKITAIHLIRQAKSVQKSAGFLEISKLPKLVETKCESTKEEISAFERLLNENTGCYKAFGLHWDDLWLAQLATRQLYSHLADNQAFIISHAQRYFLVSCPIVVSSTADQYVATLREVSKQEHSTWKSRVPTLSNVAVSEKTKNPNKAVSKHILNKGVCEWPSYVSLRNEFDNRQKRRRLSDDTLNFDNEFNTIMLMDYIWEPKCSCYQTDGYMDMD